MKQTYGIFLLTGYKIFETKVVKHRGSNETCTSVLEIKRDMEELVKNLLAEMKIFTSLTVSESEHKSTRDKESLIM